MADLHTRAREVYMKTIWKSGAPSWENAPASVRRQAYDQLMPSALQAPTTYEEFVTWATMLVQSEAAATEQAHVDGGHDGLAADYLSDLITILTRIQIGDVEEVNYPLPRSQE